MQISEITNLRIESHDFRIIANRLNGSEGFLALCEIHDASIVGECSSHGYTRIRVSANDPDVIRSIIDSIQLAHSFAVSEVVNRAGDYETAIAYFLG